MSTRQLTSVWIHVGYEAQLTSEILVRLQGHGNNVMLNFFFISFIPPSIFGSLLYIYHRPHKVE